MALSRIRQEDEELRNSLPYHWLKDLAIHPGHGGGGRRGGEHFCRCPACDYEMSVEEGQKCELMDCPLCGARMRAVSTGEYRISQAEAVPVGPLLFTLSLLAGLGYIIAKRPFG